MIKYKIYNEINEEQIFYSVYELSLYFNRSLNSMYSTIAKIKNGTRKHIRYNKEWYVLIIEQKRT